MLSRHMSISGVPPMKPDSTVPDTFHETHTGFASGMSRFAQWRLQSETRLGATQVLEKMHGKVDMQSPDKCVLPVYKIVLSVSSCRGRHAGAHSGVTQQGLTDVNFAFPAFSEIAYMSSRLILASKKRTTRCRPASVGLVRNLATIAYQAEPCIFSISQMVRADAKAKAHSTINIDKESTSFSSTNNWSIYCLLACYEYIVRIRSTTMQRKNSP